MSDFLTVSDLIRELQKMPSEAGLYVTLVGNPGEFVLASQICNINSIELFRIQSFPIDDPLNLTIEVQIGIVPQLEGEDGI